MPRYNRLHQASRTHAASTSPVRTAYQPTEHTHQGGPGYERDARSELFLTAVTHMGDDTFYETARQRGSRLTGLIRAVAGEAGGRDWMAGFIPWLRKEANMRTASLITAAEATAELIRRGEPGGRQLISSALQRADEPGEMIAYWLHQHGRNLPMPVKRGVADAAIRLYSEYSLLKYDTASHAIRFGDVIELTHPGERRAAAQHVPLWQHQLFRYAMDRRHGREDGHYPLLGHIAANRQLRADATHNTLVLLHPDRIEAAAMTWEDALSLAGDRVPKDALWMAVIPSMPVFALLRNLRNFDQAGVSNEVTQTVMSVLTSPEVIERSRLFPMRFLSAYRAVRTGRWHQALEQGLNLSLSNVPRLDGRTLVLADMSGSMGKALSKRSDLTRADGAAVFASALALRCEHADLVEFGGTSNVIPLHGPVLPMVSRFTQPQPWPIGGGLGGTHTEDAVRRHYRPDFHDRVVFVTDEQAAWGQDPYAPIRPGCLVYTFNLAGYEIGHGVSGGENRHTFGGLSDASFKMIYALEAARGASWPWDES